jgi:hypothetical protein
MTMGDNSRSASKNFSRILLGWLRGRIFLLILIILGVIFGVLGWLLAEGALPSSGVSSEQISVTVYVSISPAHLSLKSYAYLDPRYDKINVNVTGPKGVLDPWILVVQCPAGTRLSRAHPLWSEGTSGTQKLGYAIVSNHDSRNYSGRLGCFKKSTANPGVVKGLNIDATLPVLEQNASAQSAPAETPLYVERSASGHRDIVNLVEVLQAPDSSCPGHQGPTSGTTATGNAPAPQRLYATPSPIHSACYHQVTQGTIPTKYYFPTQVATFETLENVDLTNETVESMFPPGQITSDYKVKWQGLFSLSPSLNATSLSANRHASLDGFIAGVLLGLCAVLSFLSFRAFCLLLPRKTAGKADHRTVLVQAQRRRTNAKRPRAASGVRNHDGRRGTIEN